MVFLKFAIMLKKYFSILFVFLVLSLAVLSPGCKRKTEDVESEVIEEVKDTLPPLGFWPDSCPVPPEGQVPHPAKIAQNAINVIIVFFILSEYMFLSEYLSYKYPKIIE